MSFNRGNIEKFPASLLMIDSTLPKTNMSDYGIVPTPFYSYGNRYCIPMNFSQELAAIPVVVANLQLGIFNYSQAIALWVESTTNSSVVFCMHELLAFSGVKHPNKIHYYAVVPENSEASGDKHTEAGRLQFSAGNYMNQVEQLENRRYCKPLLFKYRYQDLPQVFVTPETGSMSAGMISAWINEISNYHAVICAKNQNDVYLYGVADIQVNYLVKGKLDVCSNHTCPLNKECYVDGQGNAACGCKKSCPLPDINELLCGSNYVTYKSQCYMYLESCKMYGESLFENVTVAYTGECKG